VDDLQIRPSDAAGADLDEDVLVTRDRNGALPELEAVRRDEDRRRHGRGNRHAGSFRLEKVGA
jgi:hypothetical protein